MLYDRTEKCLKHKQKKDVKEIKIKQENERKKRIRNRSTKDKSETGYQMNLHTMV